MKTETTWRKVTAFRVYSLQINGITVLDSGSDERPARTPVHPEGANGSGGHCISDRPELKRQLHNTVRVFQWPPQTFHSNITDTCCSPWSQWLSCLFILMLWRVAISKRNNLKHLLLLSNPVQQWSMFNELQNKWHQIPKCFPVSTNGDSLTNSERDPFCVYVTSSERLSLHVHLLVFIVDFLLWERSLWVFLQMTVDPAKRVHLLRAAGRQGSLVTEPNTQDRNKMYLQCLPVYSSYPVNCLYDRLHATRRLLALVLTFYPHCCWSQTATSGRGRVFQRLRTCPHLAVRNEEV